MSHQFEIGQGILEYGVRQYAIDPQCFVVGSDADAMGRRAKASLFFPESGRLVRMLDSCDFLCVAKSTTAKP